MACKRCLVSGRVQGVFFRASAAEVANRHGVRGYAMNRPDGRVEVLLAGDDAAVAQVTDWLHQGPPAAEVDQIDCESADEAEAPPSFEIR